MKSVILTIVLLVGLVVQAEDKVFFGSSEASAVVISGNSNNETYSAKTENTYFFTANDLMKIFGKYVRATSGGTENAKAWEAGLRYERILTKDLFSIFLQQKAEHDPYNGVFIQRDSIDLGGKYTFFKDDSFNWIAELGYEYTKTHIATEIAPETGGFVRAFTEASYKFSPTASAKLWVEYIAPLKSADYSRANTELSVSATLTDMFSLKTGFLLNHNEATAAPLKKDTTTWTTALVAKY